MNITKVKKFIKDEKYFSGVIQIVENGKTLLNIAKGYANKPEKIPNKVNTSFGIASGTKGFTALAILKLVEQGKLSFSDNVFDIIPYDFPNIKEIVTVKHLLSHTSGIYDYFDEDVIENFSELFEIVPINKILGPTDMLPLLTKGDCFFTPGEKFKYCNSGFVVLGILIEIVSGMSYSAYLEENIIKPLGLTRTGCFKTNQLPPNTATGYLKDKFDKWYSNIFEIPMACTGDGGLYTSTSDIAKIWKGLIEDNFISKEIKNEALKIQAHIDGNAYYGLGFYITTTQDGNIKNYGLVGCDPGVSFLSHYYVNKKRIVTIISNTDFGAWRLNKSIKDYI